MRTTRTLITAAAIICVSYGAYQFGYQRAKRQADRTRYAELMSITSHLYLAAKHGQTDRLQESLGYETLDAMLSYEKRVPESERSRSSADYSAAKEIASEFVGRMGTNEWCRGQDGLWFIDTNGK